MEATEDVLLMPFYGATNMTTNEHKPCYGTMFPSTLHADADRRMAGKAFWFELRRIGGLFALDRHIGVDISQWSDCVACPEFDSCYKLCVGKAAMEAAFAAR